MRLRIFIIDDDPDYAELIRYQLLRHSNPIIQVFNAGEAAVASLDAAPDLILCDVVMPGQGGLETLRQIKTLHPETPVVMVSAQSAVSVALEAMKLGAYDYITKGHDDTIKLQTIVAHIIERTTLSQEVATLREQLPSPQGFHGIIGESPAMVKVFHLIKKALRGDLAVAILGDSGTGKELISQAIHHNSPRRHGPFVVVNCAAIPHDLMESEFFGHEKGSFTGAHARKIGKFEQANGGTIFLDEIGELDMSLQAKLLRVLQNQELQRVGGNETLRIDVRVICATNQDIPEMIREGKFREDLYYRLLQYPIKLPVLRERDQDVLLLATHFRKTFLKKHGDIEAREFSAAARRFMLQYGWPGNVRELKNAVERALLVSDNVEIEPEDLMLADPSLRLNLGSSAEPASHAPIPGGHPNDPVFKVHQTQTEGDIIPLEELKLIAVEHAYKLCKGNINKTATKLGITRSTVYRLLKKREDIAV